MYELLCYKTYNKQQKLKYLHYLTIQRLYRILYICHNQEIFLYLYK